MRKFFNRLAPTRIGLEACGVSHYWARLLRGLGHEVVLLPPQYIKPYVKRGKKDANDAEAICEAMSRPGMRNLLIKQRTASQPGTTDAVGGRPPQHHEKRSFNIRSPLPNHCRSVVAIASLARSPPFALVGGRS
jgi:hypothetical protein